VGKNAAFYLQQASQIVAHGTGFIRFLAVRFVLFLPL
jgi:hypothetical protein